MNFLELQANYKAACLKYANDIAPVIDPIKFCSINLVENKEKKLPTDPNFVSVITAWNHSSPKPTDEQLMQNTVVDVQSLWANLVDLPAKVNGSKMLIVDEVQKVQMKPRLQEGVYIFNKTLGKMEVLVNGQWVDVVSHS